MADLNHKPIPWVNPDLPEVTELFADHGILEWIHVCETVDWAKLAN